jgi:acyl-CoA thioesterase I
MNRRVSAYNTALRTLAADHDVSCLPLHEQLVALLPERHDPPPYAGRMAPIITAALGHYVLRRSWDAVAARNRLVALTDHVHLNDRAAAVLADTVGEFLDAPGR